MKKQLTIAAIAALFATAACAAPEKPADNMKGGMMQGDMMKNCHSHMMQNGKMMEGSMSKDMMAQCHKMMKDGGIMGDSSSKDQSDDSKPAGVSDEDHKKHHPAQ